MAVPVVPVGAAHGCMKSLVQIKYRPQPSIVGGYIAKEVASATVLHGILPIVRAYKPPSLESSEDDRMLGCVLERRTKCKVLAKDEMNSTHMCVLQSWPKLFVNGGIAFLTRTHVML